MRHKTSFQLSTHRQLVQKAVSVKSLHAAVTLLLLQQPGVIYVERNNIIAGHEYDRSLLGYFSLLFNRFTPTYFTAFTALCNFRIISLQSERDARFRNEKLGFPLDQESDLQGFTFD